MNYMELLSSGIIGGMFLAVIPYMLGTFINGVLSLFTN